jgi:hypothetical protein
MTFTRGAARSENFRANRSVHMSVARDGTNRVRLRMLGEIEAGLWKFGMVSVFAQPCCFRTNLSVVT